MTPPNSPPTGAPDPLDSILSLLRSGAISSAIPKLIALSRTSPERAEVQLNLGLALNATMQFPEAIIHLKRAAELDPSCYPAWTALGVSYGQLRNFESARDALERAVAISPGDGPSHQNLSAVLGMLGDRKRALHEARLATRLSSPGPKTLYLLADAALRWAESPEFNGTDKEKSELMDEAVQLFEAYLEQFPDTEMSEAAGRSISRVAHLRLRQRSLGGFRPDVMEYLIFALKLFKEIGDVARNRLVLDISKITVDGVDINDPTLKHPLPSLKGEFTGLQLVSFLYAGLQQIDPKVDSGADFSREYAAALAFVESST
ncbi:tetratricopeptide repeat protein [Paucibacter soli]|uniref:tetratricopeptide repeat protein n=1 Tax=Paucibacter soli TaxID=3133433 RepID=UPI00309F32E0